VGSPKLDWSFANAPDDTGVTEAGSSPARGPSTSPRRLRLRRLIVGLLGVAAFIGLGAWLFTRVGLLRIQSQLAAQITYEDQRARAGDVAAVLAVQAPDGQTSRDQVAAQVRLGLAAPLPAGDLLPAGTPPRLAKVDPLGGDLFSAVVTRDYVDSAGRTYSFDLTQRYRNLAPGEWERLPPDTTALITTTVFQRQWLSVTVPTADLPWLRPALLQADDLLIQTCADWGNVCQSGQRLTATFDPMPEFTDPTVVVRPVSAPGNGYPRVFDLLSATSRFPDGHSGYDLVTPLLAGRPHDSAAQAALSRSISVRLLSLFAGEVANGGRAENDYFLDALVARAEVRHLGASTTPQLLAPQDYLPIRLLWQTPLIPPGTGGWRTDLAARREAFDFLNFALAGQPAAVDGQLLNTLRRTGMSLDEWLPGPSTANLPDAWTQQILHAFASHPVADWQQYQGLLLGCNEGLYHVQGGAMRRLLNAPANGSPETAVLVGPSPDGRYAALAKYSTTSDSFGNLVPFTDIQVIDLQHGWVIGNANSPWYDAVQLIGWSAASELIFAVPDPQNTQTDRAQFLQLMAYQPFGGGGTYRLISDRIDPIGISPALWSADHSALLLILADGVPGGQIKKSLAVLQFGGNVALFRVPQAGDAAALSPDGRRLAYVKFDGTVGTNAGTGVDVNRLNVMDLASGDVTSLAATNDPELPSGITNFWGPHWSADGSWLAWRAYSLPHQASAYLVTAPSGGGPRRVWTDGASDSLVPPGFSPDGRYLMAIVRHVIGQAGESLPSPDVFWLLDQQASDVQSPMTGRAYSSAWVPHTHRLVIAGPAGVSAFDPATGAYEWLGPWQNCQLQW
jgi:hypothetical protein